MLSTVNQRRKRRLYRKMTTHGKYVKESEGKATRGEVEEKKDDESLAGMD